MPTFVAFDAALRVKASEPLLLDALGGHAADLGWGLTCQVGGCFALAAPSRSPAALFTVPLPLRQSPYRAAAEETARKAPAKKAALTKPAPRRQGLRRKSSARNASEKTRMTRL